MHPEPRGLGGGTAAMRRALEEAQAVMLADGQLDAQVLSRFKGGVQVCEGFRFGALL